MAFEICKWFIISCSYTAVKNGISLEIKLVTFVSIG